MNAFMDSLGTAHFAMSDRLRRSQASVLDMFGLGPHERAFQVISSGPHCRLRRYDGPEAEMSLLIVPAPIKRPYIWDLSSSVSAVRYCLDHGLRVYLLEWMPPSDGDGRTGLDEYAGEAIAGCVAAVSGDAHRARPLLMGHSIGGTLAAIFCALEPQMVRGLVLLGAPLCFERASSRFRDALVSMVPSTLAETGVIPGSLLSQASAAASLETFLWSRWVDGALSLADPSALDTHARIERWALDEVALPAKLVSQIVQWLYCENQLYRGTLSVRGKTVGPSDMRTPTLAIVNTADEIGPLASVMPFLEKMPTTDTQVIECPGEVGVAMQHLAALAGRQAFARVWPQIISWLQAHSGPATQEPAAGPTDGQALSQAASLQRRD
jgi:polyhydroxyalkanoate synthase